jgi:hypothetical protein
MVLGRNFCAAAGRLAERRKAVRSRKSLRFMIGKE